MTKLIIFDLDGTLVNAYPAVASSVNFTLKSMGFKPRSHNEIKRSVGWGDRQLMAGFVGNDLAGQAIKLYRPHHCHALTAKGGVRFLPAAKALLPALKKSGYKLAIASNRPMVFTKVILKVLGIDKIFNVVLCADKAPRPKPHPDMLEIIVRRTKVKKSETIYVGDMTIDAKTGKSAGIRTIVVTTGSSSIKELKALNPSGIIHRINHLVTYLTEETDMSKRLRKGKLAWRSKRANHGRKPGKG